MKSPDPGWLPFLKLVLGFILLIVVAALAATIAIGKVEQSTSHGLDTILGCLLTLTGGFANWAFGGGKKDDPE